MAKARVKSKTLSLRQMLRDQSKKVREDAAKKKEEEAKKKEGGVKKRKRPPPPPPVHWKPETRGQCEQAARPCPYVSCRHHIFIEMQKSGSIRFPFGDSLQTLPKLEYTCSLDAAAEGEMTLQRVATLNNLTRERIRQIELKAIAKMREKKSDL